MTFPKNFDIGNYLWIMVYLHDISRDFNLNCVNNEQYIMCTRQNHNYTSVGNTAGRNLFD